MGDSALSINLLGQLLVADVAKIGRILVSAVLIGGLGLLSPIFPVTLALATASMFLLVLGSVLFAIGWRNNRKQRLALTIIGEFIENEATPSFVVSNDGEINSINQSSRACEVCNIGRYSFSGCFTWGIGVLSAYTPCKFAYVGR